MNINGLSNTRSYGVQNIQGVQATTLKKATDQDKELVKGLLDGNEKKDQHLQANGIGTRINITA